MKYNQIKTFHVQYEDDLIKGAFEYLDDCVNHFILENDANIISVNQSIIRKDDQTTLIYTVMYHTCEYEAKDKLRDMEAARAECEELQKNWISGKYL